jgi:multidrug efflux pump subunit AcrA (membrane-fusion protein)
MNMRTRTIVLYSTLSVAVVGAGGLAYGAVSSSGGSTTKTATRLVSATVATVSQTVTATGTVQPASSDDLNFTNGGVLTAVKVKAGDKVTAGQVLATIDSAKAQVALESAQAARGAAQQKLDQAKTPLTASQQAQAAASLAQAQAQLDAARQQQAGATDPADVAKAQTAVNQAQANLDSVKAANDAKATVDPVAVAQAQAALNQAALNVSDAQKALDATTLKAPAAGTISAVNFTVGQTVGGGGTAASASSSSSGSGSASSASSSSSSKAFATLLDLDHMVVKVGFPEADAGKVAAGQPVGLTIDSLTGQRLTGSVSEIDTTSTVVSNVVTYNAIVSFDSVPAAVKPGMSASVSVITASRDNVVAVPSAAISTSGGQSTVTVRSAGKDEVRPVVTGLKGDGTTEVASGLNEGDQVVMSVGVVSTNTNRNTGTQTRTGTVGGVGGGVGGGGFGGGGFGGGGTAGGRG